MEDIVLAKLDTAFALLAEADIYQTKNILDMATAAEVYSKRQKLSEENILRATSIKIEALRQLGNMLKETPRNKGAAGIGPIAVLNEYHNETPTLAELGLDKKTSKLAQDVASLPSEQIDKVRRGIMSLHEAERAVKDNKRMEERAEISAAGSLIAKSDKWHIYQGSIETWQAPRQYDFIITDPPYPREYLPLWNVLAERSKEWLKHGGLLIAMSGQSYLDEIYAMLSNSLDYYWTASYLTPGQPTPLRTRNVNTTWKPLLIYANGKYSGKIFGDVFVSDGNDKDFHKWGQSISGMKDIISKICLPGQYILDPFCGAGTTGIAALSHNCLFDGVELLEENVNISKARMNDCAA